MKRAKKDVAKKLEQEKHRAKIKRKISELFSKLQKNEEMAKMSKFNRACQLISLR